MCISEVMDIMSIHLQIAVNNITWMEVLKRGYNLSTIEARPVFCEHSFPWQVEEELKEAKADEVKHFLLREDLFECASCWHQVTLVSPCDWCVYVKSHLASVGVFHYKTESIVSLEGIFQCLQNKNKMITLEVMVNLCMHYTLQRN